MPRFSLKQKVKGITIAIAFGTLFGALVYALYYWPDGRRILWAWIKLGLSRSLGILAPTDLPALLLSAMVFLLLPLLLVVYYRIRIGLRRLFLKDKILEYGLHREYLRIFHLEEWVTTREEAETVARETFRTCFDNRFRGDNSIGNYVIPMVFLTLTTLLFSIVMYSCIAGILWGNGAASQGIKAFRTEGIPFAIVGALIYILPLFLARFAALSLTPPAIIDVTSKLWFATVAGALTASIAEPTLKPVAAFIGALLPLAAFEYLIKGRLEPLQEPPATLQLKEFLGGNTDLFTELTYLGVRSVNELAFENPIRLFVETDLNFLQSLDLVDRANLCLLIPDKDTRQRLGNYSIRTALDMMTLTYEEFTSTSGSDWKFLEPEEPLPGHLVKPMEEIAKAQNFENVESLRNQIEMMIDNPQLRYLFYLWATVDENVNLEPEN